MADIFDELNPPGQDVFEQLNPSVPPPSSPVPAPSEDIFERLNPSQEPTPKPPVGTPGAPSFPSVATRLQNLPQKPKGEKPGLVDFGKAWIEGVTAPLIYGRNSIEAKEANRRYLEINEQTVEPIAEKASEVASWVGLGLFTVGGGKAVIDALRIAKSQFGDLSPTIKFAKNIANKVSKLYRFSRSDSKIIADMIKNPEKYEKNLGELARKSPKVFDHLFGKRGPGTGEPVALRPAGGPLTAFGQPPGVIKPMPPTAPPSGMPPTTPLTAPPGIPPVPSPVTPAEFKFQDPKFEKRFKAAKGVPKETTLQKAKDVLSSLKRKSTREFEHIPKTKEFAQLRSDLLRLSKQKGVASNKAVREIGNITEGLNQEEFDLFTRKIIMDDLVNEAADNRQLPFGLTSEELQQEIPILDATVNNSPNVQAALAKRQEIASTIKDQYIASMESIGLNIGDRLSNEKYFRHQVLEHMNNRALYGTSKKLKTPAGRGFLRQRLGSESDINTDYLQAEHEVFAQMLHDVEIGNTINSISRNYNVSSKIKELAKERGIEDWHDAVPEGYTTWQPREGNIFYMANSIPENIAEELFNSELDKIGITKDDIKRIMAVGRQRSEFVVKNEVADTLNALQIPHSQNMISQANKKILKHWKIWVLGSPRRTFKYNTRNLTGDADAAFVGNPSTFKKSPRATKELWNLYFGNGEITPELRDWFDRGGMQSTMQVQEIGDINRLSKFKDIRDPSANPDNIPIKAWKAYWNKTRNFTDFRESILRYSAYLDYLEQIQQSPAGMPDNFGASIPQEIQGLDDPRDKAFFLSNDLLGAYDRVSVTGKALREHLLPFWSWKEVNFKRYVQFAKNAVNDGKAAETAGRKVLGSLAKTPFVAARVGKFLIKATAFWAMLQAWNHSMFPEEETSLSEREQTRPHIVLGKDEDGNVISFNRIGALGDFLEWFGLDAAPRHIDEWMTGEKTLKEVAKDMAQAGPNVIAQAVTPLVKIPPEIATRRALFPNIFEPRTIRDRGSHVAASLGLNDEYAAVFGKPSRGYTKSLTKALIYKTDPLQAAYAHISEKKFDFLKKIGKFGEGFWLTPRGDALYNYKLSLKFKDKAAADKYLKEYVALGGTKKGLNLSLNRMHPLGGLSKKDKTVFEASLDKEDKQKLKLAVDFYDQSLTGRTTIQELKNARNPQR